MFTHLPPLIHKRWDRGVDIGVGVITSVIIAGIGVAFWWAKVELDLRKAKRQKIQDHELDEEFERERRQQEARERHDRLLRERDDHAKAIAKADHPAKLKAAWQLYRDWLRANGLDSRNALILQEAAYHEQYFDKPAQITTTAKTLSQLAQSTHIPEPED